MKEKNPMDEAESGLVVITGCDSGIGRSIAESLSRKGRTLVVSYLDENHFDGYKNVYARKMDLKNPGEIEDFIAFIHDLCQRGHRVETVIANAGVALGGPIENIPMEIYRDSFEINYFGAITIIKALIPEIIRQKGRIVVIGSLAGRIAMPFLSPYASTKFALEGFCDSLRREMNPFGVKTILIEPAAVATPIWNKAKNQDIGFAEKKYLDSLYAFRDNFIEGGNSGMAADEAAKQIVDIINRKRPKARYIVAQDRMVSRLMTLLPDSVIDKAVVKMFRMHYQNNEKQ